MFDDERYSAEEIDDGTGHFVDENVPCGAKNRPTEGIVEAVEDEDGSSDSDGPRTDDNNGDIVFERSFLLAALASKRQAAANDGSAIDCMLD